MITISQIVGPDLAGAWRAWATLDDGREVVLKFDHEPTESEIREVAESIPPPPPESEPMPLPEPPE